MAKRALLLKLDGIYRLDGENNNTELRFPLLSGKSISDFINQIYTTYFISRELYWEKVVSYPTGNIIEIQRILASQVKQISPLPGVTRAYIVNISTNRSTILFCCYNNAAEKLFKQNNILRLVPITLPLYRKFFASKSVTHIACKAFKAWDFGTHHATNKQPAKECGLYIKSDSDQLSSLAADARGLKSVFLANENLTSLTNKDVMDILDKKSYLSVIDTVNQISEFATIIKRKWAPVFPLLFVGAIVSIASYATIKTSWLYWETSSVEKDIEQNKRKAFDALEQVNKLNEITAAASELSSELKEKQQKSKIIELIKSFQSDKNKLIIDNLNITSSMVELRGEVQSAAELFSSISSEKNLSQVEFITSPTPLKDVGERFHIRFSYSVGSSVEGLSNNVQK